MEGYAAQALLMSLMAGMSTMVGALVILFARKSAKVVTASLGFAAGIMIAVSLAELFPLAVEEMVPIHGKPVGTVMAVLFLLLGMLLSVVFVRFVPEPKMSPTQMEQNGGNASLFHAGFVSMLALSLHNFPEGMATFIAGYENLSLGITIALAIAFHNIPEGIAVALPVYYSTGSRKKAAWYTFVSGISEPIGALLACVLLQPFLTGGVVGALFALVAGIMVYIAIEELLPSSRQYGYDNWALFSTMAGVCLMPLTKMFG